MSTPEAQAAIDRIERDAAGRLAVRGSLRRITGLTRALVAHAFVGRDVEAVDKWGGVHRGRVVTVATLNSGTTSDVVIIDTGEGFPVGLSLATVDQLAEVDR